jgi:hypothetical protein
MIFILDASPETIIYSDTNITFSQDEWLRDKVWPLGALQF